MAEYLANLTNGQIDEKGIFRLFGTLLNQSGVVQSGALAVAAQGTPDMTVKVAGAATGHDIVFITTSGDTYHGWNTADKNVTISSNASGVTKTDAIVAYADLAAGISTSNNPGALKFTAVRRSGSDTGNPTSGEISTAVSSNPYLVLAYVTVANGASSINSGNITDARTLAQVEADRLEPIGSGQIANGAVTNAKLSTSAGELGAAWVNHDAWITPVGWSSTTTKVFRTMKIGRSVFFFASISGVSNSIDTRIANLPYTAANRDQGGQIYFHQNNGITNVDGSFWYIETVDPTRITCMNTRSSSAWTASGTKSVNISGFYEAAS